MTEAVRTEAVRFEGITKHFPGAAALTDVTLSVRAGSCHALCGENGAGKSTLGKLLAGIHAPDAGRIVVHGREVRFAGPRDALAAGVGMVHQELASCGNLTVAENLCLPSLPARRGFVDRTAMVERAGAMLAEIGADVESARRAGELSIAQQQTVQIAAAVSGGARVIVFDEPTSSLTEPEAERLYSLVARLTARGTTCLYVSHRMPEIFRLCDTVSVLRDGSHVATAPASELTESSLVAMMIGRPVASYTGRRAPRSRGDELLRVEGLSRTGAFAGVSLAVHSGEIVGLAGLVGAGRSEVAEAVFGAAPATEGRVLVRGRETAMRAPRDAIRAGIGLVPEDRKRQGVLHTASARENVVLAVLRRLARFTVVDGARERALAMRFVDRLRVRAGSLEATAAGLSGGNQQKLVLARWLAAESSILILDEPTRGVDVGAKAEIHALVGELAAQGCGVLLISSELPELMALSDRIVVLRAGRVAGEVDGAEATAALLLRLMAGLSTHAPDPTPS